MDASSPKCLSNNYIILLFLTLPSSLLYSLVTLSDSTSISRNWPRQIILQKTKVCYSVFCCLLKLVWCSWDSSCHGMSHSFAVLCSWMDWSHFVTQPQFMVLWTVLQWRANHAILFSFMPPNSVLLSSIPFLHCGYISSFKPCLLSFLPLSSLWSADCLSNGTISVYRNFLYLNNPWPSELQLEILYPEDFF